MHFNFFYNFIREGEMIVQEVKMIKVQPAIIARTENIARKNYKINNWIKLLSMHLENQNHKEMDHLIRSQIHQNFVMEQGFWQQQIKRKFSKSGNLTHDDIDFLMLCFEDGPYFVAAAQIANRVTEQYVNDRKRFNFALSVLQKIVAFFNHDKTIGSTFYKYLRGVYQLADNSKKIRECYQREIKESFDSMDLTYDSYKLWQPNPEFLQKMKKVYQQSKRKWQQQRIDFDQAHLSKLNIRKSLFQLEYRSIISESEFIKWLDLLPNQYEQILFLRRMVLNHRKMIQYYLTKCEQYYQADEDKIITKYKVAIRLSQHSQKIEQKYIGFLVRRINKHLINEQQLDPDYYSQWGDKVAFFREEINLLISKQRKFITQIQQKRLFSQYYKIWIEVQENIVKDKEMVCKLYENLVKDRKQSQELEEYQAYARTLIQMSAYKDAKNVLKRYIYHSHNNLESKNFYQKFINIYGSIQDQLEIIDEEKESQRKEEIEALSTPKQAPRIPEEEVEKINVANQTNANQIQKEGKGLKRQRNKDFDEVQQKIETSLRKKVHVDGQNTVFMKGIPCSWTETDVLKSLKLQSRVISVRLVIKHEVQKDYCYIEFDNKQSAQQQIRINQSGYKLNISRPPSDYDQTKTLFLCALPQSATVDKITNIFSNHSHSIIDIRLKLQKDKNYAYVDFNSKENKDLAFNQLHNENLLIDGKKILIQHCDSNRQKNKKFAQVIFLKGLAFKTQNRHIQDFFKDKKIGNISLPKTNQGKGKGFGYVQFEKFKDYQQALDMRKGTILGREFQILKSDRQITQSNPQRSEQRQKSNEPRANPNPNPNLNPNPKTPPKRFEKPQVIKDNNYFSSLFK